jgi:hypothetical protein
LQSAPCWNRTSLKTNYEFVASPIGQRRLFTWILTL